MTVMMIATIMMMNMTVIDDSYDDAVVEFKLVETLAA